MRRSRIVLVLAVLVALVTSLAAYNYINQMNQQLRSQRQVQLVPVVVAVGDIATRTPLRADLLKIQQVPPDVRHPAAFSSLEQVIGKVTKLPITSGEQVLGSKFAAQREDSGLAFLIPPSHRAVAIQVSESIGTGGLIIPSDRVDVVAVFSARTIGKDMSATILQDVEVLAVAQRIEGEPAMEEGVRGTAARVAKQATTTGDEKDDLPKASAAPQPLAKTVTLAVTPEQAQRLILAEEMGVLRLALRPYKEAAISELPEATLSTVRAPLEGGVAQITAVSIAPNNLRAGETLEVQVTVKNVSNQPLKSTGPEPGFVYIQGQTFHSQGFVSQEGTFRVGLNLDARNPVAFPYRWGWVGDLAPGASTVVKGYVKLTYDMQPTNFWAGLVQEPAKVLQDNVGATRVAVLPADKATIAVDVAFVRSGPSISSSNIEKVEYGQTLDVLGLESDWYRIRLADGREGYVAAGWVLQPGSRQPGPTGQVPTGSPAPAAGSR